MATVNVGLIGYGLSTTAFHIPTISAVPNAKVYAVVQRADAPASSSGVKKGEHVTIDYPDVKHYQDATSLFKDPNVHLVILCTPSPGHYDLAKEALENGKHVIVEKPFCPTTQDCTSLINIAQKSNLLISVYQNRRWDSDYLTLQRYLTAPHTAPLLNPIISVTSQFNRYRLPTPAAAASKGWKTQDLPGNGILYDLGSHLIDQILNLFGLPDWLWAHTDNQRQTEPLSVDDSFSVYMYYTAKPDFNGGKPLTVELKSSMVSPVARQNRWVVKSWQGGYKKFGMDVQEDQLRLHAIQAVTREGYGEEKVEEWPEVTVPAGIVGTPEEALNEIFGQVASPRRIGDYVSGKVKPEKGDYVEYYRNVIACVARVLGGEPAETVKKDLHVKAEEARNTIGVIELARESANTGNRVDVKSRLKF
ncbi:hypothetical protein H072_651 [Dactylellina haptotyla CBS 200.50]|uniref:Gfo/Idh/MocA-like oxidoreductase N-terminal domain-containing protein n=1 Tax=Dactylellina haptotyla (strain CBS 200.50) TaxID=1284197 RepID=S8ARF2_DACHA|nr:hypothetical protein H072_651 [Dactylellina haptotyla CBS 200.50]